MAVRAIFPNLLLLTALIGFSFGQFVPDGATPCVPATDVEVGVVAPEGEVVELVLGVLCELVLTDSLRLLQLERAIATNKVRVAAILRQEARFIDLGMSFLLNCRCFQQRYYHFIYLQKYSIDSQVIAHLTTT